MARGFNTRFAFLLWFQNELAESTRGQKSTIGSGNAKNPIKQNHCRQGTTKTHKAQKLRLLTISPLDINDSFISTSIRQSFHLLLVCNRNPRELKNV